MKDVEVARLRLAIRSQVEQIDSATSQKGEDTVGDTGPKVLSRTVIAKHSTGVGYISMDRDGCQLQNKSSEGSEQQIAVRLSVVRAAGAVDTYWKTRSWMSLPTTVVQNSRIAVPAVQSSSW